MKDQEILEKLIPEPTVLLGLKLLQFRLGHLRLLHRVGSAFVTDGVPSYDDLATAVFICSRSYEEAVEAFDDPTLPHQMSDWAHRVHGQTWDSKKKRWKGEPKPIDLFEKWTAFESYIQRNDLRFREGEDYAAADSDNTRRVHAPFCETVRVKLQAKLGFRDSEILNRPWSWCMMDYYLLADADGIIQIGQKEAAQMVVSEAMAVAEAVENKLRERATMGAN